MIDLMKHNLYDQERSEFNNILNLLLSEDMECVKLGVELLKNYSKVFPINAFNFTPFNIGELISIYENCKGIITQNNRLKSIVYGVRRIIENNCYWYKKCG